MVTAAPARQPSCWRRPIKHTGVMWAAAIVTTAWLAGLLGVYVGARVEHNDESRTYQVSTQAPVVGGERGPELDRRIDVAAVTAALRTSAKACGEFQGWPEISGSPSAPIVP